MAFQRRKPVAIGVKAPFPGFVEPALATAIERVPQGERWIHEIKFDGYRVQLQIANEDVKVFTRRGNDWTRRFRKIANDAFLISASSAIIDGRGRSAGGGSISRCCRTSSRENRTRSPWSRSTCFISTDTTSESSL